MNFYRAAPLLAALVCVCDGVHVTVREKQRFAMLFQSVVLPCQYQTASTQNPVVQWWYKSYCRDRTRESFTLPESLGVQASELGAASHLECSDSGRTVRVVASAQGASMTLAEHLFLVPVQKQTCASGSCSGGTVEFTSVKSSLLMI